MRMPVFLSYLTLYLVWGSTYFFIKMGVATLPPLWVVAPRFLIGGFGFLLFALISGRLRNRPTTREVATSLGLGMLLLAGGNGLVTVAEQTVDSYLAALVVAATPLVVAIFDRFLFAKKIAFANMSGIFIGIVGVGLLVWDGRSLAGSLTPGIAIVLAGLVSWAFATSLGHRARTPDDLIVNSGIQMAGVGIAGTIAMLVFGPSPVAIAASASIESWLAVAYLAVAGSLAFAAYTYLIRHEPAIRVVSYAFVNPLIAVFLGLFLGGESATPYLVPGALLVLAGLALMMFGERLVALVRADDLR